VGHLFSLPRPIFARLEASGTARESSPRLEKLERLKRRPLDRHDPAAFSYKRLFKSLLWSEQEMQNGKKRVCDRVSVCGEKQDLRI
jgi:hypothetical protein